MPEQHNKINLHIKPKPKIIRSDFSSIYQQAFHQVQFKQSELNDKKQYTHEKADIKAKRMSVLDVLNRKITISHYQKEKDNHITPLHGMEKVRERKKSLTSQRMSANAIHNKIGKDSIQEDNKNINESHRSDYQSAFSSQKSTSKEKQFIKNNIQRFFVKQDSKAYTVSNGKAKVKMIIRQSKSMKTIGMTANGRKVIIQTKNNDQQNHLQAAKSLLMPYNEKNKSNKLNSRFKSLSSLSHHPKTNKPSQVQDFMHKVQNPLPLINHINLAERPEHSDNAQLIDALDQKQKININEMFSSTHSDFSTKSHLVIEKHKFSQIQVKPLKQKNKSKLFKIRNGSRHFQENLEDVAIEGWSKQTENIKQKNKKFDGLYFEEEDQQSQILFHSSINGA